MIDLGTIYFSILKTMCKQYLSRSVKKWKIARIFN